MQNDDPGAGFPPECSDLMERTMQCVERGDIKGCMKLQAKANECLRRHGYDDNAIDMPEEYFELMYKGILAHREGREQEFERLQQRMDEVYNETVGELWGEETAIPIPEECLESLRGYMLAANGGDWDEARKHAAEVQRIMTERGLEPLPLTFPEDYQAEPSV